MLPWKSVPTLGLAAQGRVTAKRFIKPIPNDELLSEIDVFCELFSWPALWACANSWRAVVACLICLLTLSLRTLKNHVALSRQDESTIAPITTL